MTTTAIPELPEPELGYIETDKSRQPAFSARQMREALQAQPAAVSDDDILRAAKHPRSGLYPWGIGSTKADFMRAARAILALRPQAEPVGEAGTMPGTPGFTMACFQADKVPAGTKLYAKATQADFYSKQVDDALNVCITYVVHGDADFSDLPDALSEYFRARVNELKASMRPQSAQQMLPMTPEHDDCRKRPRCGRADPCAWDGDVRDRLTVNLLRQDSGLNKTQIRALIDHAVDGIEPDPALFAKVTPEPVGEAWGWAILDKHGTAQAIRPKRKEFFGSVQEDEPFSGEDIAKMDREWVGLAPHTLVTLYTPHHQGAEVNEQIPEGSL